MPSRSEQKNARRELIKAIAHTHFLSEEKKSASDLAYLINHNHLIRGGSVTKGEIGHILSRATFNSTRKRFKNENGIWSLNI